MTGTRDWNTEERPEMESTGIETKFGPENPARILPLISGSGNRRLLSEWISDRPEYEVVHPQPESPTLTTANFDLCILDKAALQTYIEDLRARKEASAPVQLPYLLLFPEDDSSIIEVDKGELADTVLREAVDEIVSLPLKKAELAWRVKALLRVRSQSLQLEGEKRKLRRFKQATDSAGHAVYITDPEGFIEYVNPAFEYITGYDAEEAIGENPRILNSGMMSDDYFEELWKTVTSGEIWEEEVINERKTGEIYHADQTIAPIIGSEDTIDSYVAIQQDITHRKQERRKLEQYKQGVESAIDLLAAVDTDLNFLFANEKYCQYHGLEPNDIEGKALPEVLGSDSFAQVEEAVKAALQGEEKKRKITRELPDLGERTLEAFLFPILDDEGDVRGAGASMRDITEQKEHERHLETLISNLPGIIYRCEDERGWPMKMVRGRSEELTGYTADQIEGSSISWGEDIIHPKDRETVRNRVRSAIEAGEPFELTYRIITRSEELKWVWEKGREVTPVNSDEPQLEGFISDITERKEREKKLRESRARLDTLFENSPDMINVLDPEGTIVEANQRLYEELGYEENELLGTPIWEHDQLVNETDVKTLLADFSPDERRKFEGRYEHSDGSTIPVEVHLLRLDLNDQVRFMAISRDITERKDREEKVRELNQQLKEEKERYESLFNSIRDAILVADTDRRIINCNPAFSELFGYELSEIKGKPTKYVYESEAEFEEIGEAIEEHIDDPKFTYNITYEKKSGQTFPGETNLFYLHNADGEIVGFIGVIRDISEQQDRLTQLQVIDRVLQHNFHNDINVIQGFAEQIETGGSPPLTNYAETIRETGEGLLETVKKEREITNFLSDPPPTEIINLARVTEHVVEEVSTNYPEANISTNYIGETRAEATVAIEHALEELVINSIIHSDSEEPRVTIQVESSGEYSTISVSDENPRIPEMERKVLTGEEKLSPLYHGSGMGLWLVMLIVNHPDGVLEFEENEPQGNIVEIRLPAP